MQSLQTFPNPDTFESDSEALKKACASMGIDESSCLRDVRVRARERTLGLLRLFGPDSKMHDDDSYSVGTSNTYTLQSAGESPTAARSKDNNNSSGSAPNRSNGGRAAGSRMKAKDGLSPRLTEEEIRKLVHSKDTALAQILEEHESEMNVMATNMEELRLKSLKTQRVLKKRRKRTIIGIFVGTLVLLCGGTVYEYHRRERVKLEIKSGREAERRADAKVIASLKGNVATLTSNLADAEATIRYEEGRYGTIKTKYESALKTLEETEGKWLLDKRDLDRCRVTRKELDNDLSAIKARNDEVEEEVNWCRDRLKSTERALEAMQDAVVGGGKLAIASGDGDDDGEGERRGKAKPVRMEMKYNKSFRNAVILRQLYSGLGGMVVSVVANALFPGLAKVITTLFLK